MSLVKFGTPTSKPPLLFVHGSYCGAWIWEKHFIPYFEEKGYWGGALTLRGHEEGDTKESLDDLGLQDFVEDIAENVKILGEPPVLIGHSLGGLLTQLYAKQAPGLPGQVLLCSPSPLGLMGSSMHIGLGNPALAMALTEIMAGGVSPASGIVVGHSLYSATMPIDEAESYLPLLRSESKRAAAEAYWPQIIGKIDNPPPTLVLGGLLDAFIPTTDLQYTSGVWDATLKILPQIPHGVMLDPTWEIGAREIDLWIKKKVRGYTNG